MREIDKLVLRIEECITTNSFYPVETDKIELKDLSGGSDWRELHKTVCSFLNSKGGIIILGIREDTRNKKFIFTGFHQDTEPKIKDLPLVFTDFDGKSLDLQDFIRPDLIEIKPFLAGQVCLVFVEKLPDELKYVFYRGVAYERQITGDHRIPPGKIQKQKEFKEEIIRSTELDYVPNATLDDLDIDKLNDFIFRLNSVVKVESYKQDIQAAIPFLSRKKFLRDGSPTLLGMLVCGKELFDHVGGRCEIDAYYESGVNLADDKKIYTDNIIPLMESGWNFTFAKIGTGVSILKGGTSVFEYPEEVIRETVNNALAHRDYKSDRFCLLRIRNNEFIEIRNPGRFRQEQLVYSNDPVHLRRIIPLPKRQNAHLADVLKAYNRYEGRGIGMASLTNFALANEIDIPYFRLYGDNEIGLFIPKGRVLDENSRGWLKSFNKYIKLQTGGIELSEEQKTVLAYFRKSELLNADEKYTVNLTPDNNHFDVIKQLEKWKIVKRLPQNDPTILIYLINPFLLKEDFREEIVRLIGGAFERLTNDSQEIMQALYLHNEYGTDSDISANLISDYLYFKKRSAHSSEIQEFANFKRKVRGIINNLEKSRLIRRKAANKPNYEINPDYLNL
jgi:predicted HTH transcriptional regulator